MSFSRHKIQPCKKVLNLNLQSNQFLASSLEGKVKVSCQHDMLSSLWGVLQSQQSQPAWILYMNLFIEQPTKSKLSLATVSIDFQPTIPSSDGVIVTNYYGPVDLVGRPVTRNVHKGAMLKNVKAEGMGFGGSLGGELGGSVDQEQTERWKFTTTPQQGNDSQPRGIKWTLEEARHAENVEHAHGWKLGAVLQHDRHPFNMEFNISIRLRAQGFIRFLRLRPSHSISLISVTPPADRTRPLDQQAEGLNEELLSLNRKLPTEAIRSAKLQTCQTVTQLTALLSDAYRIVRILEYLHPDLRPIRLPYPIRRARRRSRFH